MSTRKPTSMALRLGIVALAAFAAVAVAVLFAAPGGGRSAPADRAEAANALRGIPQSGIALGDPDAPVTLVEFADLQCPFCREYHEQVFPTLLEYVKAAG